MLSINRVSPILTAINALFPKIESVKFISSNVFGFEIVKYSKLHCFIFKSELTHSEFS